MSNIVISGDTSGSSTLQAPAVAGGSVLTLPVATDTLVGKATTDVLTNKTLTSPVMDGTPTGVGVLTSGSDVASTSGKTIDFSNIPSWAKRITIMLSGISTAGASDLSIQIGTSSGIETTGYSGAGGYGGSSATVFNSIAFVLSDNITAAQAHSGIATLCLLGSNTWVESGTLASGASTGPAYSGGTKTLAGTLDRIRLTTTTSAGASGIDNFDAGSINIMYE